MEQRVNDDYAVAVWDEAIARDQVLSLVRDLYRQPWRRDVKEWALEAVDDWANCIEKLHYAHESQRTQVVAALLG